MLKFTKMHGNGNDFIVVEADSWAEADKFQPYSVFLCQRNYGVGADGVLVVGNDKPDSIFVRVFSSDGSETGMSVNGIICAARYAYEQRMVKNTNISVRTLTGSVSARIITADNEADSVQVDNEQSGNAAIVFFGAIKLR